jgi:hypothetical protein
MNAWIHPGVINVPFVWMDSETSATGSMICRRRRIERFRREHSGKPVRLLKRRNVAEIIAAKKAKPDAANNLRKILHHLMEHAIALGMIEHNPVIGTKRLKTKGRGLHTWTDAEIMIYRARWPLGTQQRLCMELALDTTSRRTDITLIGPQHRRGDVLDLRHTKNDSEAFIPLTDELRSAIDAMPIKHLTYLHTQKGARRSPFGRRLQTLVRPGRSAEALHAARAAQGQHAARRRSRADDKRADEPERTQDLCRSAALHRRGRQGEARQAGDREAEAGARTKRCRNYPKSDPLG